MGEISRGIYPKLPWKTDLQQCLEIWRSHFRGFLKSAKADLEISYDEEIQGDDIITTRASPREVEAGRDYWQKPEVYSHYRFGRVCRTVA